MQKIKKYVPFAVGLSPLAVFAADVYDVLDTFSDILNFLVPILIALAVVIFLVGVVKYITAAGDEEKRASGRNTMIYGIIGLFVMVAVWGLVNVLFETFDLTIKTPDVPELPRP